jgi:hypothetical protein
MRGSPCRPSSPETPGCNGAFVFDMNGIPRGKRIRRSNLLGVAKGGLMMPSSVFVMDPHGNCVEETGRLWHPAR